MLVKELENKLWGMTEGTGTDGSGEEEMRGGLIALCNWLKGGCSKDCTSLFFLVTTDEMQGNGLRLCQGGLGRTLGRIIHRTGGQALEWAAQGGGRVNIK